MRSDCKEQFGLSNIWKLVSVLSCHPFHTKGLHKSYRVQTHLFYMWLCLVKIIAQSIFHHNSFKVKTLLQTSLQGT